MSISPVTAPVTSVVAEDAPLGVQLWPTTDRKYADNYTLAMVTARRGSVVWTYCNGTTRTFARGERVTVRFA